MKIQKSTDKNTKRIVIISVLTVVLIATAVGALFYSTRPSEQPSSSAPGIPAGEQGTINPTKEQDLNSTPPEDKTDEEIQPSKEGAVVISGYGQSGGVITASATVTDFQTVKCVYLFESSGAKPVVKETANGCDTVSINEVVFDKVGTYTLTVTAYSANEKIVAAQEVQVK